MSEREHLIPMSCESRQRTLMLLFAMLVFFIILNYGSKQAPSVTYTSSFTQETFANYSVSSEGLRYSITPTPTQYEGVYYRPGEYQLNPRELVTFANWWMHGEYSATNMQGCFGDPVDGSALQIATWFYDCGTRVLVINPITGQQVIAEVTDRGPNRYLNESNPGWGGDRVRAFGADISPGVAQAIGQNSGEAVIIRPIIVPNRSPSTFAGPVNLTQSPAYYSEIDVVTSQFIFSNN
jgi:hypothetical protein